MDDFEPPSILEKDDGFSTDSGSKSSSGTEDYYEEQLYALAHFSDPNKTNPNSDVIEVLQHTVDPNTPYQPSRWNKVMRLQGAQIIENADNPDNSITKRVSTFDSSSPAENYIPLGPDNYNAEQSRERIRRPNRGNRYSKTRKQRGSLPELDAASDRSSDDIALWRVQPSDYATTTKSRFSKLRCHNCKELGHVVSRCTTPTKKILCIMCGRQGHTYTRCRDIICLKCGEPWTSWSTVGCDHCRTIKVQCHFCRSMDHLKNACPEVWRRYHSTVEDYIEQFDPPPALYKPNSELSCPNCTRKGHKFEDCKMSIPFKKHRPDSFNGIGIYDRHTGQETDIYYSRGVTHRKRYSLPEKVNSSVDLSRRPPVPSTSRDPPGTSVDPSEVLQMVLNKGMRRPKSRTRNNRKKRARQTMQFEETRINKQLKIMRKKDLAKKRLAKKNLKMKQIFARNLNNTTGPHW